MEEKEERVEIKRPFRQREKPITIKSDIDISLKPTEAKVILPEDVGKRIPGKEKKKPTTLHRRRAQRPRGGRQKIVNC